MCIFINFNFIFDFKKIEIPLSTKMKDSWVLYKNRQIFTRFYNKKYDPSQPTIVMLHEALGSVAQWKDFPSLIAEKTRFNVWAYDRLGHGFSDPLLRQRGYAYLHLEAWEVLPSILEQLNIKKPILWGHSDGGSIALLYASRYPVKALITEAAHIFVEEVTLEGIEQTLKQKDFLIEKLARFHGEKTADLFAAWSETWLMPTFRGWNIENVLKRIECPSVIVQGENDEYGTIEQVNRITKGIGKHAKNLILPNCGHAPYREAPILLLNNIINFLTNHV